MDGTSGRYDKESRGTSPELKNWKFAVHNIRKVSTRPTKPHILFGAICYVEKWICRGSGVDGAGDGVACGQLQAKEQWERVYVAIFSFPEEQNLECGWEYSEN